jgi:polynucleotide 5'-kinase involved in rRNA processing
VRQEDFIGLLVGLNDSANETQGLGVLKGASEDGKEVYVLTPLTEQTAASIRILQVGSTGPE